MNDSKYTILAGLGLIVLVVCFAINVPTTNSSAVFDINNSFYIPQDIEAYSTENSAALYQEMIGNRSLCCPVEQLSTDCDRLRVRYNGTSSANNITWWLLDNNWYSSVIEVDSANNTATLLDATAISRIGAVSFSELGVSDVCQIISPYGFTFGNNNTAVDSPEEIVIYNVSSSNPIRITFSNVANWYCAGEQGTTMTVGSSTSKDTASWEEHGNYHLSIIGSSSNAVISGGSAGSLIGYGNPATTVTIEQKTDNTWDTISILEWLTG